MRAGLLHLINGYPAISRLDDLRASNAIVVYLLWIPYLENLCIRHSGQERGRGQRKVLEEDEGEIWFMWWTVVTSNNKISGCRCRSGMSVASVASKLRGDRVRHEEIARSVRGCRHVQSGGEFPRSPWYNVGRHGTILHQSLSTHIPRLLGL